MRAKLHGAGFDIQPPDAVTQGLGSTRPIEWTWTVRPTSTGHKKLHLDLAVMLAVEGQVPVTPAREYVEIVDVSVDPVQTTLRLARGAGGILSATGLSLAVIIGGLWTAWRRRRSDLVAPADEAVRTSGSGPESSTPTVRRTKERVDRAGPTAAASPRRRGRGAARRPRRR